MKRIQFVALMLLAGLCFRDHIHTSPDARAAPFTAFRAADFGWIKAKADSEVAGGG